MILMCRIIRLHLLLGHVQQTDRVAVAVEVGSHRVQGLVELPLDVRQLLKYLVGRPQQQLPTHRV